LRTLRKALACSVMTSSTLMQTAYSLQSLLKLLAENPPMNPNRVSFMVNTRTLVDLISYNKTATRFLEPFNVMLRTIVLAILDLTLFRI
jgi:hypothetical protein